ncbi:MAG: FAD-dependent oxidoreductase [Nitrospiraceae bacterium]|nr:FAD-dependent oxidoreductase [Nitrospiraceae bacterium]
MEKKYGVYICKGCGIGEAVDVQKLIDQTASGARLPKESFKSHDALCSPEGIAMINTDIKNDGINAINIVACSQRSKVEEFDFPGCVQARTNIRELVAWSQPAMEEPTQALARDYAVMGVIKIQKGDLPEPGILENLNRTVLVVGGGMTGLSAALESARAGYDVILVEKEAQLGGWGAKIFKSFPMSYPFEGLIDSPVHAKIKEVQADSRIKIYTGTTIQKIDGQPGLYDVTLQTPAGEETLKAGAIVLAAGWKPYDATKLTRLGYGLPNVVTSVEFEEMAKTGKITRPSDGKPAKKVAFIQCAGSRDPEHLPYCSHFCCSTSLKQAKYVRELGGSDAIAMIFYKDIRTPGQSELFYKNMQNDPGVMLTKGDVTGISEAGSGKNLYVEAENTLLGEKVKTAADLVVLAIGVVPATAGPQQYLDGVAAAGAKGDEAKAKYIEETPKPEFLLNLGYKQGPEIPSMEGGFGFADSNFLCFQYETRRTGIYAAGCVRQPMTMAEAAEDAAGAAMKAVQVIEHVAKGIAVHPRAWDITFPDPMMTRCTSCKRCTEECPFGAIDEDAKGTPFYKINRCRRCGTCMGACPERIVSFKDYHVDMIGSMIKSVDVPEEGMTIIALACENDAYAALDTVGIRRKQQLNPAVRILPVRCLGSTNLVWVADAFSRGIDGLMLLGCKFGEDYQCHFVKGSELASYRFSKVQETLNRLQLEAERCQMLQVGIDDYAKLPEMIDAFVKNVEDKLGPNPFKGF